MSTQNLYPSSSRVSNRNSPRSSGTSTPVSGQNVHRTQPTPAPASERMANPSFYAGSRQPSNWGRLVNTDPLARELEWMSSSSRR